MGKVKTRPESYALCARCGRVIRPGDRFDLRVLAGRFCRGSAVRSRVYEVTCSVAEGRGGCA